MKSEAKCTKAQSKVEESQLILILRTKTMQDLGLYMSNYADTIKYTGGSETGENISRVRE